MSDFPKKETLQEETTNRVPEEKKLKLLHKKGLYTIEVVDSTQEYDAYEYDKETQTTTYYRCIYPEISDEDFLKLSYGKEIDLGIPKCTKELHLCTRTMYPTQKSKSETKNKSNTKHQNQTKFYSLNSGASLDGNTVRTFGIVFLLISILGAIGNIILAVIAGSLFYFLDGIILFATGLVTYTLFNTVANISNKTNAIISYLVKEQRNKE